MVTSHNVSLVFLSFIDATSLPNIWNIMITALHHTTSGDIMFIAVPTSTYVIIVLDAPCTSQHRIMVFWYTYHLHSSDIHIIYNMLKWCPRHRHPPLCHARTQINIYQADITCVFDIPSTAIHHDDTLCFIHAHSIIIYEAEKAYYTSSSTLTFERRLMLASRTSLTFTIQLICNYRINTSKQHYTENRYAHLTQLVSSKY